MRSLSRKYQRLVVASESSANMRRAFELTQEAAGVSVTLGPHALIVQSDDDASWVTEERVSSATAAIQEIVDAKPIKSRSVGDAVNIVDLSTTVSLLALGPAFASDPAMPESRASLLIDSCQLVFHQTYHVLLPKLEAATDHRLRVRLLNAFLEFASSITDPANRSHLLARCYEAYDDNERAAQHHAEAVRTTPSDAHNFMTLLQIHWDFLVDHQRFAEALEVLLEAYPRVRRSDIDETAELIRLTFELQARSNNLESASA